MLNYTLKPDELELLRYIYFATPIRNGTRIGTVSLTPREIIEQKVLTPPKRCHYILDKWCSKGWFEYGVSLDLGWLTDKGIAIAAEIFQGKTP